MLNCKQATRLMSDGQDRHLSFSERTALKLHVMMCKGCRNFGQQMHTLRGLARRYVKGNTPNPPDAND